MSYGNQDWLASQAKEKEALNRRAWEMQSAMESHLGGFLAGTGGCATTATDSRPKRGGDVPVRIEVLEKGIAALRDAVMRLRGRLDPVLVVKEPGLVPASTECGGSSGSPLADILSRLGAEVASIRFLVSETEDGLDL